MQAEEEPIPMCLKPVQERLAWMNSKLPLGLRKKQRVQQLWKMGQATQEDFKDAMKLIRDKTRKVKSS